MRGIVLRLCIGFTMPFMRFAYVRLCCDDASRIYMNCVVVSHADAVILPCWFRVCVLVAIGCGVLLLCLCWRLAVVLCVVMLCAVL